MATENDFIKDWLEGKVSAKELENKKLQGDPVVNRYEALIKTSSSLKVPVMQTKEQAWEKLSNRITEQSTKEAKTIKLNRWFPISIAASLALMALSYFLFFNPTTISTQMAETKIYVLPDGSEVFLNADSKISFKKNIWKLNRSLTLEGEAFFKVKKGSRFTVISSAATVAVLGTSFNVNVRPNAVEISCFTGKVKVSRDEAAVILTKGEFTQIENDSLIPPAKFEIDKMATWRNGEFYFDSKPLSTVIAELERQFNVTIEFEGDTSRLYTGYFNIKTLDEALSMVFKPMSLNYTKVNNKKIIVK
jgi:transmembrane sensor